MPSTLPPSAKEFIEKFGLLIEDEGLPRIAGRIMGYLLLSKKPSQAAELAAELMVSHGSVSTNTRLLERLNVIQRVAVAGERAAAYQITQDPYGSLLIGQLTRMRRMHSMISEAREEIPGVMDVGRERLGMMARFYSLAIEMTQELLGHWDVDDGSTQLSSSTAAKDAPLRKLS